MLHNHLIDIVIMMLNIIASYNKTLYAIITAQNFYLTGAKNGSITNCRKVLKISWRVTILAQSAKVFVDYFLVFSKNVETDFCLFGERPKYENFGRFLTKR